MWLLHSHTHLCRLFSRFLTSWMGSCPSIVGRSHRENFLSWKSNSITIAKGSKSSDWKTLQGFITDWVLKQLDCCAKMGKKKKKNLGKCYKTVFYILKIYFRMSKLRKCAILRKISAHFELLAAMHLKKIGQGLVHHCVTSCPLLKTFWAIYFSCFSPLTQNVVAWGEAQLSTERSEPPFNPNAVSHWVKTVTFQTRKPNKGVRRQWNVHKSWS